MDTIGRFKILKRLGGGGFGEVFLGEDPDIGRQVAIKVFKPKDENLIAFATSSDEEGLQVLRARFLREARILASLDNTVNIVGVLDYGELPDGAPYYVMPYLPHSLADELGKDVFDAMAVMELAEDQRPRALPLARCLAILEQLCRGLAAAHGRGLIHRDIKPSNIMLTEDGEVRLVDFGIAKVPDEQHSTVSHLGMGSRNYMAPEQRESAKHVDARADVYALGRVAYRMLTGKLPVGRFADPNVAVPALGQPLNDLLLATLAEDREQRPENAASLLERFLVAKAQAGESGAEDTGTWVGGGEASVRDELKPLRARIAELVGLYGLIPEREQRSLRALAAIADLQEDDLKLLIHDVVDSDRTLSAKQTLAKLIAADVAETGGALSDEVLASLQPAAEAVGWDTAQLCKVVQQAVPSGLSLVKLGAAKKPDAARPADGKSARTKSGSSRSPKSSSPTPNESAVTNSVPHVGKIIIATFIALILGVGIYSIKGAPQGDRVVAEPADARQDKASEVQPIKVATPADTEEKAHDSELRLESSDQRLSYGIAFGLGRRMAADGVPVDTPDFSAGLRDALEGAQPRMSEEEIQAEMKAYQERGAGGSENSNPRLSYGIAWGLGQRMAADAVPIVVAAFTAGLADGFEGRHPRITETEIQAEMQSYQERTMAEQQATATTVGAVNRAASEAFLAQNARRAGVVVTKSGLQYEVVRAGSGTRPGPADSVEVHYRGTLVDGSEFDSSYKRGEPVSFGVGQVIAGWTEALQLMAPGAKWNLYIPADLAYGAGGAGTIIGPNSALVFEVELLSVLNRQD